MMMTWRAGSCLPPATLTLVYLYNINRKCLMYLQFACVPQICSFQIIMISFVIIGIFKRHGEISKIKMFNPHLKGQFTHQTYGLNR